MKTIKQYIQFAIDNGLRNIEVDSDYISFEIEDRFEPIIFNSIVGEIEMNFIECITSKEFIEAIAKGLWNNPPLGKSKGRKPKIYWCGIEEQLNYEEYEGLFEDLTLFQAIAIRDNKLEEFITNLLNG